MRKFLFYLFFGLFCCLALVHGEDLALTNQRILIYKSDIDRLSLIYNRLIAINSNLSNQLVDSQGSLKMLKDSLMTLNSSYLTLKISLDMSLAESQTLKSNVMTLETSLSNLEQSFQIYKQTADQKIKNEEFQKWIWGIGGGILGSLIGFICGAIIF